MHTATRTAAWALALGAALAACRGRNEEGTRVDTTAASAAAARDTAPAAPPAAGGMTDANIAAVLDAANESDSAFGALAVRAGRSADVKQFGRLMMGEHHALRLRGQQLVKKLNVTPQAPPSFDLPERQRTAMTDLQTKSGAAFDRAYIDHEVAYHQQVLTTAQRALDQAQNEELKSLIREAAPVIQRHLDRAKEIQRKLGSS